MLAILLDKGQDARRDDAMGLAKVVVDLWEGLSVAWEMGEPGVVQSWSNLAK